MASYYLRISPVTPVEEIQAKLQAFKTLYGEDVIISAKGYSIETTRRRDNIVFAITSVDVVQIGKQYITIKLRESEGGELLKVNMKNPNHGIQELMFLTRF